MAEKVEIEIGAKDKASAAFNKAGKSLTKLQAGIITTNQAFDLMGKAVRALSKGYDIFLSSAANFEKSMSKVQALTGATWAEFDKLSEKAQEIYKDKLSWYRIATQYDSLIKNN